MNEHIIKQDSLLSNISNITVKIDHNHKDGSGFFQNYLRSYDQDIEVPIQALQDDQSLNHESLLEKIIHNPKYQPNISEPDNTWINANNPAGLSEEQEDSQKIIDQEKREQIFQHLIQPVSQQLDDIEQVNRQRLLLQKRLKNETKNIPKNYGKAIISFIEKYQEKVKYITKKNGVDYKDFIEELKQKKKAINTIADLRSMWVDYKHAKCIRLLSNLFLRKYALSYIFNSRICNYSSHIKYRYRLCDAIKEPFSFKHIKDY